jgi:hypothetical protein
MIFIESGKTQAFIRHIFFIYVEIIAAININLFSLFREEDHKLSQYPTFTREGKQ